jgi:7,8-dihydropterin-6-yl-methyl-4-(beta-D-ribofuranosyl)aminobenzene 5'-phosphate synthase
MTVNLTVVYDNDALPGFRAAWGFSCYIRHTANILFDTGGDAEILLHNMKRLGISKGDLNAVVLSHDHWDHVGGLAGLAFTGPVYVPSSSGCSGIFSSGTEPLRNVALTREAHGEHSLILKDENGVVLVTGCAHNGLAAALAEAEAHGPVRAVIGGFHDFSDIELLRRYPLVIPCHCTREKRRIGRLPNARRCKAGMVVQL